MATMVRGAYPDLVDVRFTEIMADIHEQKRNDDMVPVLWTYTPPTTPFRPDERGSQISGLPVAGLHTGSIGYQSISQGYDWTATYVEFSNGVQLERLLLEFDQFNEMEDVQAWLSDSMWLRRQLDGARPYRNAFSIDNQFYNHSEGVALCSDSHTTTTGASTTTGFDNLVTSAFSATNVAASQIQMMDFRDLQAQPVQARIDTLAIPKDKYEQGFELVASMGKVDASTNNRNVHYGAYTLIIFPDSYTYTSTANWFGIDSRLQKRWCQWFDQVYPNGMPEFGWTEVFDTYDAKYRAYMRYTQIIKWWQWIIGANVSS